MRILADKNIPYLNGIAEYFGDVTYIAGKDFSYDTVRNADTLIVRTVVKIGEDILKGSMVKLICTASIGFDHIDTDYCNKAGIVWHNAPGSNSGSVMQYVLSSLLLLSRKKGFDLKCKTIGIIGAGNVGSKVAKACRLMGMKVLLNDPPRKQKEDSEDFVDIETIKKEADIISFHVPLTKDGMFKTFHMADDRFFASLAKKPIVINTARGSVFDTKAIKEAIQTNKIAATVIDCWENEPVIDTEYMSMVDIATPHIAGYSADGKANATRMSLERVADFWRLSKDPVSLIKVPEPRNPVIDISGMEGDILTDVILKVYSPETDMEPFIKNPDKFQQLRDDYPVRREYPAYKVINVTDSCSGLLKNLGFVVE